MERSERPTFAAWVSINCFFMLIIGFIGTLYVRRLGYAFPVSFLQGVCFEVITIFILLIVGYLLYERQECIIPMIASIGALAGLVSGVSFVLYVTDLGKMGFSVKRWYHPDEVIQALAGLFSLIGLVLLVAGLFFIAHRTAQKKYHNLLASLMLVVEWLGSGLSLLILVG